MGETIVSQTKILKNTHSYFKNNNYICETNCFSHGINFPQKFPICFTNVYIIFNGTVCETRLKQECPLPISTLEISGW